MNKVLTYNNRIIVEGHANTKEECETITLLCDCLSKDKNFNQVAYDNGYAEFEKVGHAKELKFAPGLSSFSIYDTATGNEVLYVNSDGSLSSISYSGNVITFTESNANFSISRVNSNYVEIYDAEKGNDDSLTVTLKHNILSLVKQSGSLDYDITLQEIANPNVVSLGGGLLSAQTLVATDDISWISNPNSTFTTIWNDYTSKTWAEMITLLGIDPDEFTTDSGTSIDITTYEKLSISRSMLAINEAGHLSIDLLDELSNVVLSSPQLQGEILNGTNILAIVIDSAVGKVSAYELSSVSGENATISTLGSLGMVFYIKQPTTDTFKKITKLKYKVSDVCQLLDKSQYPERSTSNGVTFTVNDGVVTANGTASTTATYSIRKVGYAVSGHKYLLIGATGYYCYIDGYINNGVSDTHFGNDVGSGYIFTASVSGMIRVLLRVMTGYSATNVIFRPQLFDLTEMYGAGNEPTTLAEFRQKYPNELYPYSPQCWLSLNKTRYMSNQFGNSILTDNIYVNHKDSQKFFFITGFSGYNLYKRYDSAAVPRMGLLDYKVVSNSDLYDGTADKTVSLGYPGMYDNFIMVRDLSFNGDIEKFKQFIIGNNVWFELETPAQGGYLPLNKGVKL